MNLRFFAAAATLALALPAFGQAQFEQFRGKMKPGLYEYKMEMDMGQMPGVPPGMGKQSHTMRHCVTEQDIAKGAMGRGDRNQMPENCEVKDFKMSGNTATYRMACKGSPKGNGPPMDMDADNRITFNDGGYVMDMKVAMNQGGHPVNMNQHIEGRLVGACSK